jgi:hypothetical protein
MKYLKAILLAMMVMVAGVWAAKPAPKGDLCELAGEDRQALADVYRGQAIWMLGYPPIYQADVAAFWTSLNFDLEAAGVEDSPVVPVAEARLEKVIKRSTKWTKGLVDKLERELWDIRNELEYCGEEP